MIPQKCSKSYNLLCFKLNIIKYVNKVTNKKQVQLIPGVYLEKMGTQEDGGSEKPEEKPNKGSNDRQKSEETNVISITGKPEEQIKRYDKIENADDTANEQLKRDENDSNDKDLDKLDADYFKHLLSQNKSGTWLSTELLDDDFVDYLIEKFDRYFQTRNLKIQMVESIKRIDQEVFGGVLPSAETGEWSLVLFQLLLFTATGFQFRAFARIILALHRK